MGEGGGLWTPKWLYGGNALADKLASVSSLRFVYISIFAGWLVRLVNFFSCFLMDFMVLHGVFVRHVHAYCPNVANECI